MDQCNSCGAFEADKCSYCPTLICSRCKPRHEAICEYNQKRIKRGEGPTIANMPQGEHRRGHETPEPAWAKKPGEKTDDGEVVWINGGPVIETGKINPSE
jgi:hypothetical protein